MRSKNQTNCGNFILLSFVTGACVALIVNCAAYAATSAATTDNELKAAYIARLTEFIEWPADADEGVSSAFRICVFGEHPIRPVLEELPRLMSVDERSIEINRIDRPSMAGGCEILFVPASQNHHIPRIHQYTDKKPVLVINEIPDVPAHGQLISIYKEGNRLRIQIHLQEAQAAGFKISSRLLKLAKIVE